MIFEQPSTRTRVSFEVAMTELGGHALYLKPGEIHLGVRESMYDTAKVLSRMCDAIFCRALKHETITELAKHADVPVFNGLTDYNHPTQVVCDVTTMLEHMPAGKKLEELNVTFIGDATNVLSSLMLMCTKLGINFTHAAPKKYQASEEWVSMARENCAVSGGTLTITENPVEAVKNADFIYTDLWWWAGQENQIPERRAAFMPDDAVDGKVLEIERVDRYKAALVLEGGSIHVDGEGTCLTTAECLLSPGRNPDLSQDDIENYLKDYLNAQKVLWIPRGVYNDETTGHVDNLACYLRPAEIALTWTDDRSDPQYERSAKAYEYLMSPTDAKGRKITVHKIHQPNPILITPEEAEGVDAVDGTLPREAGDRLAASYINFYFCNGGAIVPIFGDWHDAEALETLQKLLPERRVVGVPAREILLGGGNIHCITQQQP